MNCLTTEYYSRILLKDFFNNIAPIVVTAKNQSPALSGDDIEAAKARLANPGIGVTSASRRRRSIGTFPPQEPRIPRALQSSVEPTRPPRCLPRCGNPRRFFAPGLQL